MGVRGGVRSVSLIAGFLLLGISGIAAAAPTFYHMPAPVGLTAVGLEESIELRWQYGAPGQYANLKHFAIYRSTDRGRTFCRQATVERDNPSDELQWVDEEAPDGWSIYYIRAVSQTDEITARSNTAAAFPQEGADGASACPAETTDRS